MSKIIKGEELDAFDMPPKVISTTSSKTISEDGVYELEEGLTGTLTIKANRVSLIGSSDITYNNLLLNVTANDNATLQIKDLHIYHSANYGIPIKFPNSTGNKLILKGDNVITAPNSSTLVYIGGGLEITGTGTLLDGSGQSKSIGTGSGADLGGSNITISGSAKISNANIGAGDSAKVGNIYVCENASVNGGIANGVGSTCGTIYIYDNASVSGSHIGSGIISTHKKKSSCGSICIGGNANVSIVTSSSDLAAIGASKYSSCGSIRIGGNAKVFARGNGNSAAIGSSSGSTANGAGGVSRCSGIIIGDNARVTAISDSGAAAIGSGCCGVSDTKGSCGSIRIGGNASVTAINTMTGARSGAAIGSGFSSKCDGITIGGSAQVSASVSTTFVSTTGYYAEYAAQPIGNAYSYPNSTYTTSSCGFVVLGKNATVNGSACTTSGYEDINFDVISDNI